MLYSIKMISKKFKCKYCNKILSSQGSLSNHINKSKQCISQRTKTKCETKKIFSCKICPKVYKSKQSLNNHMKTHNKELEKDKIIERLRIQLLEKETIINQKDNMIEKLQNDLKEVAIKASTKPSTINNRNTYIQNNLTPLTDEDFTKNLDKLTARMIMNGYEKIGEYALNYPLKDKLICVDSARKTVKYKDELGSLKTDAEMTKICDRFFKSIKQRTKDLDSIISEELEPLRGMDMYDEVIKTIGDIMLSSNGYDTKLKRDFSKYVCNRVNN